MLEYLKSWRNFKHYPTWYYTSFTYNIGDIYKYLDFKGLENEKIPSQDTHHMLITLMKE